MPQLMSRAAITGTGHYVPDRVVTNEELTRQMDTSDAWIVERSGIDPNAIDDVVTIVFDVAEPDPAPWIGSPMNAATLSGPTCRIFSSIACAACRPNSSGDSRCSLPNQ